MLYGNNIEQLAKLRVSIFALLAWIDYSSEFILLRKHLENTSKFATYFLTHSKIILE